MSKTTISPIAAVVGAALIGTLGAIGSAQAADNPFGATALDAGYLQVAGTEGKCGGKEGGEGKCGGKEDGEGKCGGKEGGEGKCGEGKCGGKEGGKEG